MARWLDMTAAIRHVLRRLRPGLAIAAQRRHPPGGRRFRRAPHRSPRRTRGLEPGDATISTAQAWYRSRRAPGCLLIAAIARRPTISRSDECRLVAHVATQCDVDIARRILSWHCTGARIATPERYCLLAACDLRLRHPSAVAAVVFTDVTAAPASTTSTPTPS